MPKYPKSAAIVPAVGALALLPAGAWSAMPRKDAGYQGVSSQKAGPLNLPVALRVARNGRSISRFDIQWSAKCASPTGRRTIGGLSVTRNRKLTKRGSFSSKTTMTQPFADGTKGVFTTTLKGKFGKRTLARGTFKVAVSIRDAAGQQTDTCDSKTIKWSARD